MDVEAFRNYCLAKNWVTEELPFGPDTLVFKVGGKIFALCGLDNLPFSVNLKCEPDRAILLREEYPDHIRGAYHMNKKHWNSLEPEFLPQHLVTELIDHSYSLVVLGLPKKLQQEITKNI